METTSAPFKLSLQDRSFPAPSGSSSQTVDWLPDYLGYSWVAYGSHTSLVISIAPVPTRKDEADLGLCQVIDTPLAPAHITCVRWAPDSPPCIGFLAASTGHLVCIHGPEFSNPIDESNCSEFPQGWVLKNKLEHTFQVWSFAWTESGDGLLSVGTEVVMWRQNESSWCHLWTSHVTHPQSLAAATLSAKGLAATADGDHMNLICDSNTQVDEHKTVTKGKATVWWWEDSLGLLEAELLHPQGVLVVQWRPSKEQSVQEPFRPVLMTACKDGTVRLWLEIDSGRARLDKALGKDVPVKHLKPAYFVSAVIEAEQCLHGILGKDVFVSWPVECRSGDSARVLARSSSGTNTISKRQSIGSCEWLIGLGPEGSICLWSLFCLDDIYPPRCPRVFLWKQSSGVLSTPVPSAGSGMSQVLMKVVAQRSGNKSADPPSFLDLFCTAQPSLFQWSRVWPPVSALCGNGSKETLVIEAGGSATAQGTLKKDSWGVVTEYLRTDGHSCDIINIAVHPITHTGLVATLDSRGDIFLWCTSSFSHLANITSSLCVLIWKPSGRLSGPSNSKTMTWLPAVFPRDQTVLLLAHAGIVDCYLVSDYSKTTSSGPSLVLELLSRLNLCVVSPEQGLHGIWAMPMLTVHATASLNRNFIIIGLGEAGHEMVSCNLEITIKEADYDAVDPVFSGQISNQTDIMANLSAIVKLEELEPVSCIAVAPSCFLPFVEAQANCLMFEPLALAHPYDFATGSTDGMLRLWKKCAQNLSTSMQVDRKDDFWLCVGMMKVNSGPLTMLAIGCSGLKIATWCSAQSESYGEGILIWDIESYIDYATFNLSGRVSLVGCPTSMQWLEVGNGQSMLGFLTETEVHVYAEARGSSEEPKPYTEIENPRQIPWIFLASAVLFSSASCFSWGPKGSLFVPFKDHLLVYGPRIFRNQASRDFYQEPVFRLCDTKCDQAWSLLKAGEVVNCPLPMYHPVTMLYHLLTGNHQQARICLSYLQQNIPRLCAHIGSKDPCGPLHISPPMHLMEIFQMKTKAGKKIGFEQGASLSWSSGSNQEFDNYAASFSRMTLLEEVHGLAGHQEVEASIVLNVEKLESSLKNFSYALGLAEDQEIQLLTVADVLVKMDTVSKSLEYASLDPAGQRFWLSVQLSCSNQYRRSGKNARLEDLVLETKVMAWALQSDCKDTLLDICLCGELLWPAMRALGVGFWLTDIAQLRTRMEKVARAQYLMEKDPKHCALLYLALQRKNVLMGLFKLSKDEKDRVLYEFLARDFQEEKNRAAALKNAYILMGKHRHDLAAAFFLLGGDLSSAAFVCAKNLGDLQLALVTCRLLEGSSGMTEQRLIKDYALPNAQSVGDHWLASLFQCLVGERFRAIEELTGRLMLAEINAVSDLPETEKPLWVVSSERSGLAFVDPEVGHFCLLLAAKLIVQSGLSVASAMALRKWIILKTSAALERWGLPLQALEHLNSAVSAKEAVSDHSQSPTLKQLSVRAVQDSSPPDWQAQNFNVILAGVDTFVAMKMRFALQYQAQLVHTHPCWRFEDSTRCGYPSSWLVGDDVTDPNERPSCKVAVEANEKLLQSLNILENRFTVDTKYIVAELARLAYVQNQLYLQCLFTREAVDESQTEKQISPSMPNLASSNYFLKKAVKELPRVIVYPGLACSFKWNMTKAVSLQGDCKKDGGGLPIDVAEILLLASDLGLLLAQNMDKVEAKVDIALLILILCCVAAWKRSHWDAIRFIARSIKSWESPLSLFVSEMEAAFRIIFASNDASTPMSQHRMTSLISSDSVHLTEYEVWHVLGLAFWDALLGWAKKHYSGYKSSRSLHQNSIKVLEQVVSERGAVYEGFLKALALNSSFFQRKLVSYINSSIMASHLVHLRSWLWGNQMFTENPPSGSFFRSRSSLDAAPQVKSEDLKEKPSWPSMDNPIDEVWRELVVHNNIRSALELGGARCENFSTLKDLPKSNAKSSINGSNISHDKGSRPLGIVVSEKPVGALIPNGISRIAERSTFSWGVTFINRLTNGEEVLHSSGDLFEALCVNSCCPEQVVVASNRKGLIYLDLSTGKSFSSTKNNLWGQAEWPENGWAKSESTPVPTFVSPGVGLGSKEGPGLGLGGATVGLGTLTTVGKESSFKGAGVGIPGYGGVGAFGIGWDDWEDFDGIVDPLATMENVNTQAMDSHPLRPLFLVGSRNTHVYLWEFGKSSATATYGILPAANIPPPYALASVSTVKFDHSGHRFATSAIDGTVCTWQLEVGGRSNVRPTESCLCFDQYASDVAFVGASGGILAATGASQNDLNLVFWDTLAPSTTSRASVFCHEGGARCLEMFDRDVGGGSISPLIVTGGKAGDIAVHDFRYIATGKTKRQKHTKREHVAIHGDQSSQKKQDGELNVNGMVWYIAKAHSGSITCVSAVPGTSLFFTGSKDGDVKLWDANKCELVNHWHKVHDKHMFLQHNARGFGAVVQDFRGFGGLLQAAVTDIHPVPFGFLTCGGDGFLRLFHHRDSFCKAAAV